MAWTRPEHTRQSVNLAGRMLISVLTSSEELDAALAIINNWRSSHSYPLQSIKMTLKGRARKMEKDSLIAQRIKRIPAIGLKLLSNETMVLASMHDIGGCRAVLRSVSSVEKLVRIYEDATAKNPRRGCLFHRKYDYINSPKLSGYRGVHLVYRYRSDSKSHRVYNDLKIEIQLRSRLQHAWATAVETVSMFTGQALKSNIGEASWKRFFVLIAAAIANIEKRPLVPGVTSDPQKLKEEIRTFQPHITMLREFTAATELFDKKKGHVFLLELNPQTRTIKLTAFQKDELNDAQERYLEAEKSLNYASFTQAVLVSVDSVEMLRKAYPNYFLDISGFLATIEKVLQD